MKGKDLLLLADMSVTLKKSLEIQLAQVVFVKWVHGEKIEQSAMNEASTKY